MSSSDDQADKIAYTKRDGQAENPKVQRGSGREPGGCNDEAGPQTGINRRAFLQRTGMGVATASLGRPLALIAGAVGADDTGHGGLIPADKGLAEEWVQNLFERGTKEIFSGEALDHIGMPCGGIGAGQLYLCGDGTLGSWQIFNNAVSNWVDGTNATYEHTKIAKPVEQGYAVLVRTQGELVSKRLCRLDFPETTFRGEYPIGTVSYRADDFPVMVEMEAFSPFVPLNAEDSALPATLFHITVSNVSDKRVSAGLLGWLENHVGYAYGLVAPGRRISRVARDDGRVVLTHAAEDVSAEDKKTFYEHQRPKIVFADFEGADYRDWTAEGEAFGPSPARGTLDNQNPVTGYQGEGLVNSYYQGDGTTGRLISPDFQIERRFINFLIGGGAHAGKTCANLVVEGEVVRTATGRNSETLFWASWDVSDLEGRTAHIEAVDEETGGWGHINLDQIEFVDIPPRNVPDAIELAADWGTMTLATTDGDAQALWADRRDRPADPSFQGQPFEVASYDIRDARVGVLRTGEVELEPAAAHTFTFVLTWHFPNEQPGGRFYAVRFKDAEEVADYVLDHHDRFTADTRLWRDTYYNSTLPYWLLDRLHSTLSYLATGTCQWWKNGRFWAYEGVASCHGTCTHVWNYAHGHARLFPSLARTIREMQDFAPRDQGGGFHPDTGLVGFRSDDNYAADGQCGTILKAYREHLMSTDNAFLKRNWPRIKKALEFSIGHDGNADGLIEDLQHNTYDINYFGANSFVGSLYLAALRAGEEMARETGDEDFAETCRAIYDRGRKKTLARLWNGEYFEQDVDLEEHPQHQYKDGCLSDHLFGQGWAHQLGLGYIYPEEHVHTALQSIWKYNWAPDIGPYNKEHPPFRWFITPGQAGLFTCTWPKGNYMPEGTVYKNEVWTGIEYQVAGHMIWEGFVREGLVMCRAIHDRYRPALRNPYNEVECGDHYARALASWGVYLALMGFAYHGPEGRIGFAPRITPEQFRAAFTTADGWGTFEQVREETTQRNVMAIHWGKLHIKEITLSVREQSDGAPVRATIDSRLVQATPRYENGVLHVELAGDAMIARGQRMEILIG